MQKAVPSLFIAVLLVPVSLAGAQEFDNFPKLAVELQNKMPFVYKDSEGYTVVAGLVENNDKLVSITNARVQAHFYDEITTHPLEVAEGQTLLQVIPAEGVSPYIIRSVTPNPDITHASVSLLGFEPSVAKQKELAVSVIDLVSDDLLHLYGTLENGGAPVLDTRVYLAMHDAFDPPRILGVETVEIGQMAPDETVEFEFSGRVDARAVGIYVVAESNVFYSDTEKIRIPESQVPTRMVSISNVIVEDAQKDRVSELAVGEPVTVKSELKIRFAPDSGSDTAEYTYYVQVKESGRNPAVEYLGIYDGEFERETDSPAVSWTPQNPGLYFVETFVWDRDGVPMSPQGPVALLVVK